MIHSKHIIILVAALLNGANAQIPVQPGEGPVVFPPLVQPGEGPVVVPPQVQPGEGPVIIDSRQEKRQSGAQQQVQPMQPANSLGGSNQPVYDPTDYIGVSPTRGTGVKEPVGPGPFTNVIFPGSVGRKEKRQFGEQKQPQGLPPANGLGGGSSAPLYDPNRNPVGVPPTPGTGVKDPGNMSGIPVYPNGGKERRQFGEQKQPQALPPANGLGGGSSAPLYDPNRNPVGVPPTGGKPGGANDIGAIPLNPRKERRQIVQPEPPVQPGPAAQPGPVLPPSTPNLPIPGTISRRFRA